MSFLSSGVALTDVQKSLVSPTSNIDIIRWEKFDYENNYCFGNGDNIEQWKNDTKVMNWAYWDKLKRLMSIIQFLTLYLTDKHNNPIILYIGKDDCIQFYVINELFPDLQFHIYSSVPLHKSLSQKENITYYNTDFDPNQWINTRYDIFLITEELTIKQQKIQKNIDIDNDIANNIIIWELMLKYKDWIELIKPAKSLLSFSFPKYDINLKLKDTNNIFTYLDGTFFKRAWTHSYSSETGFVPNDNNTTRDYNILNYENMLFHHNKNVRHKIKYLNPFNELKTPISTNLSLYEDYDSHLTVHIILSYLKKYQYEEKYDTVMNIIEQIISIIGEGKIDIFVLRSKEYKSAEINK